MRRLIRILFLIFIGCLLVFLCTAQDDDEFMEFYDPEEIEAEGLKAPDTRAKHPEPSSEKFSEEDFQPEPAAYDFEPDDEEFEGYIPSPNVVQQERDISNDKKPQVKVAKAPQTFQAWNKYVLEMIFMTFILAYLLNYMQGRGTNSRLAHAWYASHHDLLSANFALVGDDPSAPPSQQDSSPSDGESTGLLCEAQNLYTLWCSGRQGLHGMLVELRLLGRQDLPSLGLNWLQSLGAKKDGHLPDRVVVKAILDEGEMSDGGYVMAVGVRRRLVALAKDHFDLATYPTDRRGVRLAGLPEGMVVLSEIGEATAAILNPTVVKVLNEHQNLIEYIYISDQYSGPKSSNEELKPPKPTEVEKVLIFSFFLDPNDVESMKPLFNLIFYLIEKARKLRLSKEAKAKSEKARAKVGETLLKSIHAQRQEAAQNRRDEQRRAVKERIMAEEDPEKARRLEEREAKREKKRMQRIKMVKMK